jgi:hypothetical protein
MRPGSRFLFLSRQEKEAKEGDRDCAALLRRVPGDVPRQSRGTRNSLRSDPFLFFRLPQHLTGGAKSGNPIRLAAHCADLPQWFCVEHLRCKINRISKQISS